LREGRAEKTRGRLRKKETQKCKREAATESRRKSK